MNKYHFVTLTICLVKNLFAGNCCCTPKKTAHQLTAHKNHHTTGSYQTSLPKQPKVKTIGTKQRRDSRGFEEIELT